MNFSDLEKELRKHILSSMKEVETVGKDTLVKNIQEEVYDVYTPKYYKRTNQLKKSATGNTYQLATHTYTEIFNFKDVMIPKPPKNSNNHMGQHYSTAIKYNPQAYHMYVAETVNDGTSGLIFGKGKWTTKRPFFTDTEKFMRRNFGTILKASLVYKGLNIK